MAVSEDRTYFLPRTAFSRACRRKATKSCWMNTIECPAAVKPAGAFLSKDILPVDVARLQLRGHGIHPEVGPPLVALFTWQAASEEKSAAHLSVEAIRRRTRRRDVLALRKTADDLRLGAARRTAGRTACQPSAEAGADQGCLRR